MLPHCGNFVRIRGCFRVRRTSPPDIDFLLSQLTVVGLKPNRPLPLTDKNDPYLLSFKLQGSITEAHPSVGTTVDKLLKRVVL